MTPADLRLEPAEPLPLATCLAEAGPPPPIDWLAEGFLLDREIALLAGDGGSYKTTVALAIAGAIAAGQPVLGAYAVKKSFPVLIVSEEDSLGVIQNRIDALIAGSGWHRNLTNQQLHVLALEGCQFTNFEWILHLEEEARRLQPALVIFDPLADLLGDNENDPTASRPVLQFWRRLTRLGTAVLTLAHFGKPKEGQSGAHRVRGASSWPNGARSVYSLEARNGDVQMTCEKQSRAPKGDAVTLTYQIDADPSNAAVWQSARFQAPVAGGAFEHRRALTGAERTGLTTLGDFRQEPLSFTAWQKRSGLGESTLSNVRRRLLDLRYAAADPGGKYRGRDVFCYKITPEGSYALNTSNPPINPPMAPRINPPILQSPPKGGIGMEDEDVTDCNVDTPACPEPVDDGFWDSLVKPSEEPDA